MNKELLKLLQRRIAGTSAGPSTAHGMGPKGTVAAAPIFLAELNLLRFSVRSENEFKAVLNRSTRAYVKKLPKGSQYWGCARKFLNIFLRGVVYNKYLCSAHEIPHIEPWLEVPLDSHVAKGLRRERGGKELPKWRTVIGLDARTNTKYQQFAGKVAAEKGIHRVHLDLLYWRPPKRTAKTILQRTRDGVGL